MIIHKIKSYIATCIGHIWILIHRRRDRIILICPMGIGDALFVGFFVDELSETTGKKISVLCKRYTAEIFRAYDSVSEIYGDDRIAKWAGEYCVKNNKPRGKGYIYGHFTDMLKACEGGRYSSIPEYYYRDVLGLTGDMDIRYPDFDKNADAGAVSEEISVSDKDIIISPYAGSSLALPDDFWNCLVKRLSGLGYDIYTNVNGISETELEGTKPISLSLSGMAKTAPCAGAVICFRSGLCDLLACTKTRLIVINNLVSGTGEAWSDVWDVNHFSVNPVPVIETAGRDTGAVMEDIVAAVENQTH